MKKIIFFVFICCLFSTTLYSHIDHYSKLKLIKYNLYFNNELIGYHSFKFKKLENTTKVFSEGAFKLTKLGINLMNYRTKSISIYKNNKMINFKSETYQNDKRKYSNIVYNDAKKRYIINGSSFKGEADLESIVSSLWNHEILVKKNQISSISGSVNKQKVKFYGKKKIKLDGDIYNSLKFQILSDDNKSLKDKKINIDIWYQEKTLIWLKAAYEKLGNWEYKLSDIEYR